MAIRILSLAQDQKVADERRSVASRVVEHLRASLPDVRLLIVLDKEDWRDLKYNGEENRGAFIPLTPYNRPRFDWPGHLSEELLLVDLQTWASSFKHDFLVYLHESSCLREAGIK